MIEERIIELNPHWSKKVDWDYPFHRQVFQRIWSDFSAKPMAFLTGPRRTGKSVILRQLIMQLMEEKVAPTQILFFEFAPRDSLETVNEIWQFFKTVARGTEKRFAFFDELQYIDGYESLLKEIYDNNENLKIAVTGSLSLFYKRRMEESLAGRYFGYRLFPLNFKEYLTLIKSPLANTTLNEKAAIQRAQVTPLDREFREFLSFRRLPETVGLTLEQTKVYVKTIIDQTLTNDAFNYFAINKPQLILALFSYIRDNNGGEISVSNLAESCGANVETVTKYLEILEIMGLVYAISNSPNPIVKLNSRKKYYVSSHVALLEPKYDFNTALGFAVESYVLEQLLEQGETVTFFRHRQKEVDFLLPKKKTGFEVKYRLNYDAKDGKVFAPEGFEVKTITALGPLPACLFLE